MDEIFETVDETIVDDSAITNTEDLMEDDPIFDTNDISDTDAVDTGNDATKLVAIGAVALSGLIGYTLGNREKIAAWGKKRFKAVEDWRNMHLANKVAKKGYVLVKKDILEDDVEEVDPEIIED